MDNSKKAFEESVPFNANSLIKPISKPEIKIEVKSEVTQEVVEVNDFVSVKGTRKRSLWRRWKSNIEKICSSGKKIVVIKADGTKIDYIPTIPTSPIKPDNSTKYEEAIKKQHEKAKRKQEILDKVKIIDDPEEEFDAFIEVAVSCTWFQKRLNWMMSSILNQKGDVPKIIFNVAYVKNNGNPTTEKVCEFFRNKGLNIKETVYDDFSLMQYRGFVRNRQLLECKSKWMFFADCDMVYSSMFFDDLAKQLRGNLRKVSQCISARRISLGKDHCKDIFNNDNSENYPKIIDDTDQVSKWPVYTVSRSCGAGYMQICNVRTMRYNTNGFYVDPLKNPDLPEHDLMHKTYSDRNFRMAINGVCRISTKPQYHLNHERDNETGGHLILQR